MKHITPLIASLILLLSTVSHAATQTIPMYLVAANGEGKAIGSITVETQKCGVLLTPNLHDLSPGIHGIHVHQNPACADNGNAAGSHLDPQATNKHEGPYAQGHLGDLPVLIVDQSGNATTPMLAPKFTLKQLSGHSIIIHAGGDNYADQPAKLGGGGARIACGIIPS